MVKGGIIDRYVRESVFNAAKGELTTRGWFGTGRQHKPIIVTYEFPQEDSPVETNTLAMSVGDTDVDYVELGSTNFVKSHVFVFDFFAEDDSVGSELIGDLQDFFYYKPNVPIYDYSALTTTIIFYAEVVDAFTDRPRRVTQGWQKHWHSLGLEIEEGTRA